MKVVDANDMRKLEDYAISDFNVPSIILMENAAQGAVSALISETGDVFGKKIHIFCGGGNNGGDGLAMARILKNKNADVKITLLKDRCDIKGDAKANLTICEKMGIPFVNLCDFNSADIIIDAIFGTGMHGDAAGIFKDAIEKINESHAFVLSVDIPSGVSANSGYASSPSALADLCVTFSALKLGHLLFPGKSYFKKLVKVDISIPQKVINEFESGYDIIDKTCKKLLPKRSNNSHKGSFGKALAYVGGKGTSGAACLSSSAILKSGAGMVMATVPESIYEIVAKHIPSVMVHPITSKKEVLDKISWADVLLLGCGTGVNEETKKIVFDLIKTNEKPMCLDADALNIISENPDILLSKKCEIILTPHILEFSRLSGLSVDEIKKKPIECAKAFSKKYGVTLVLKDAVTIVSDKFGHIFISSGSNSGMATAGSGDVLAGIITGLLAQGVAPLESSVLGVYIHLASGMLAKDEKGEFGMTAEDILKAVPYAIKENIDIPPNIKEL